MPDSPGQEDFERESSRLSEGLKTCRSVVDNYRAMMAGDGTDPANDDDDASGYVSTIGNTAQAYEGESELN